MSEGSDPEARGWLFHGGRLAAGALSARLGAVRVEDGKLSQLRTRRDEEDPIYEYLTAIDFENYLILPGLINAHDHLEFNLFPRLGRGPYPNSRAWAGDIYRPDEEPVRTQLRVPKADRLLWGGLKNLLSGVTTVCHHNPYEPLFDDGFPVRVLKRCGWAHSLAYSPDVREHFDHTPPDWPFVIHLGEGADAAAAEEIFELDRLGALDARTVLVHGVAIGEQGLALVRRKGASLVWCPSSNLFMLGRTLGAEALASGIPIALGTDSALTAEGNLLDELRLARGQNAVSERQGREAPGQAGTPASLYLMVTAMAAAVLRLDGGEGTLIEGGAADLIALRDCGRPCDTLLEALPGDLGLVMVGGRIKLLSREFAPRVPEAVTRRLHPITISPACEFLVDVDVPALLRSTSEALGDSRGVRLAGRIVESPQALGTARS